MKKSIINKTLSLRIGYIYFAFILVVSTLSVSCKKNNIDNNNSTEDKITLSIKVSDIENQINLLASSSNVEKSIQTTENKINDNNLVYSTSFEEQPYTEPNNKSKLNKIAATTPINSNVIYRFIVYELNGGRHDYRGHKDLTSTVSFSNSSIEVYKGRSYKWVAYSYNNSSAITETMDTQIDGSLLTITTPIDKDLLYATGNISIPIDGTNNITEHKIDIHFTHRLARLAITLKANEFPASIKTTGFSVGLASTNQSYFKSGTLNLVNNTISNVQGLSFTNDLPFNPAVNPNGDSTRVAYLYTADFVNPLTDLTLRVNSLTLQDMYTYRDGNYPEIMGRDIVITAKTNKIPQAGTSHTPLVNFFNTDGVRKGNVIWARGNLNYSIGLPNPYKINKTPNGVVVHAQNDYWMYNSLTPWDANIVDHASHRGATWTTSLDPCRQVPGGWRLPTLEEFLALGGQSQTTSADRRQSPNWDNASPVSWGTKPYVNIPQNSWTSFRGDDGQWVTFFKTAIFTTDYYTAYNHSSSIWALGLNDSVLLHVSNGNAASGSSYDMIQIDGEQDYMKKTDRGLERKIAVRCVKDYIP